MGINKSSILERNKINLNETQNKMIASGWGKEVLYNTVTEKIIYLSDGLKVMGYISYPINKTQKYPVIVWNRGGYQNKGVIDQFTARGMFGQIANWGYVVLASQYRGNAISEGMDEVGGKDVNDILNLIPIADEFEFADNGKCGIEGWSRGGMMSYLTLLKKPDFKCAVLIGAISDFKNYVVSRDNRKSIYEKILSEENFEKKLDERSAINFVDKLPNIPYLIMHGILDETIPFEQSVRISEMFTKMNYNSKMILFEGGDHYLKKHRKEVDEIRKKWFEKYLK
jgi:dipeptidyl aminopeptidase/acylaminoacyl peptidase